MGGIAFCGARTYDGAKMGLHAKDMNCEPCADAFGRHLVKNAQVKARERNARLLYYRGMKAP